MQTYKFCPYCGSELIEEIPQGDDCCRPWCEHCQVAHYRNPKILVATFLHNGNKLLWTKRGIEPGKGKWAFPAGFVECNESLQQAAARELLEETAIDIAAEAFVPMSISSVLPIDQIYMVFRVPCATELPAQLTEETLDWGWFERESAPWDNMAHVNSRTLVEGVYDAVETGGHFMRIGCMANNGNRHQLYPLGD